MHPNRLLFFALPHSHVVPLRVTIVEKRIHLSYARVLEDRRLAELRIRVEWCKLLKGRHILLLYWRYDVLELR